MPKKHIQYFTDNTTSIKNISTTRESNGIKIIAGRDAFVQAAKPQSENRQESISQNSNKEYTLPVGYKTESGKKLQNADSTEFIIKPDGSRDFGYINEELAEKSNAELEKLGENFRLKSAPVRLQVGKGDSEETQGFGYIHILKHFRNIYDRGFNDIPSYVTHILENFNQVYKSNDEENRIILYCKDDHSKGVIPIDLELEKGEDDYYTIVSAYPRRRVRREETLLVDTRPTNVPTDAVSVPRFQDSNNTNGVVSQRDIADSNVSSAKNISQATDEGKQDIDIEQRARDALKAAGLEGKISDNKNFKAEIYDKNSFI